MEKLIYITDPAQIAAFDAIYEAETEVSEEAAEPAKTPEERYQEFADRFCAFFKDDIEENERKKAEEIVKPASRAVVILQASTHTETMLAMEEIKLFDKKSQNKGERKRNRKDRWR